MESAASSFIDAPPPPGPPPKHLARMPQMPFGSLPTGELVTLSFEGTLLHVCAAAKKVAAFFCSPRLAQLATAAQSRVRA